MPAASVCPTVVAMSLRRRMPTAALALLAAVALAGCSTPEPSPTATTVTRAPLFASDAEALAAATKAYAAYLKVSDEISHDGGRNPERIKPYATGNALDLALKSAQQFRDADAHAIGETKLSDVALQRSSDDSAVVYACEDVSGVDIIGRDGTSLVPSDRRTRYSVQISVALATGGRPVVDDDLAVDVEGICK